jgi:two-component system CheB/CheR fusion protein
LELVRDPLLDAVTALASARDEAGVCSIVRRAARDLTGADGVTFVLRRSGFCFYADEDAIGPLWKGRQFPIDTCISGWAMIHRQHVVIPDIYSDDRIPHDAYRPTFVKSLAMVPVRREDPIAAIGAYWASYHVATPLEIGVLQNLADAAALALYNVQLDANLKMALSQEREAREAAESASRVKDEFLALLSHELRTPLHVINNWIWQLKQGKSISPMILTRALEVIERNTALQSRLVEDLLDVSRAAAGKMSIDSQLVDLGSLCTSVVDLSQPSAREKSISLTLNVRESSKVWGDPDRLHQVLNNVGVECHQVFRKRRPRRRDGGTEGSLAWVSDRDQGEGVSPGIPASHVRSLPPGRCGHVAPAGRDSGWASRSFARSWRCTAAPCALKARGKNQGTTIHLDLQVPKRPKVG